MYNSYQRIKHLKICITFERNNTAFQKYFATLANQIIQIHAYKIFDQSNCTLQLNPKHNLQTPRTWINTQVHIPFKIAVKNIHINQIHFLLTIILYVNILCTFYKYI